MQHRDVGVSPLLPADEDAAKAIHPTMRSFDDPTSSAKASTTLDGFRLFAARFDVRGEFEGGYERSRLLVVVTLVEAEVLRIQSRGLGSSNGDAVDRLTQKLEVVDVRARDGEANRNSVRFRQQTALAAALGAIGRIGPGFFPHRAAPSTSLRPSTATPSRRRRTGRRNAAPEPRLSRTRRARSTRQNVDGLMSSSRCPSHSARSIGSRCGARTRSHSWLCDQAPVCGGSRADDPFRAPAKAARFPTKGRPEFSNCHLWQQGPLRRHAVVTSGWKSFRH